MLIGPRYLLHLHLEIHQDRPEENYQIIQRFNDLKLQVILGHWSLQTFLRAKLERLK